MLTLCAVNLLPTTKTICLPLVMLPLLKRAKPSVLTASTITREGNMPKPWVVGPVSPTLMAACSRLVKLITTLLRVLPMPPAVLPLTALPVI